MEYLLHGNYFGSALKRKLLNGIILIEKEYYSGERIPLHAHENSYFCSVIDGNWEKRIGKKKLLCSPLKSIFHKPDIEHSDIFFNKTKVFDIELDIKWLEKSLCYSANLSDCKEFFNNSVNWLTIKIYYEFVNNINDSALLFEELIQDLLTAVTLNNLPLKEEKSVSPWLKNVREFIDENYARSITFQEISKEADVHPVHLVRTFKLVYKSTLGDYQRKLRIKAACEKLIFTNLPYGEIALLTGFYDQSHFYRIFRKYTGLIPSAYREIYCR
ncbi:MAG: hypothetical protein C0412_12835 [Flavobacterium sp.]|nr:hypothetical protein [Flavobacterium sp.]